MHRTKFVPQLGLSLIIGLLFQVGGVFAQPPQFKADDQNQPVPAPGAGAVAPNAKDGNFKTLILYPNQTKQIGMTPRGDEKDSPVIAKVVNENPRVARVQSIITDPRHVLVTGLAPGTTKVTFTDIMNNVEVLEVRVTSEEEPIRETQRQELVKRIRQYAPTAIVEVFAEPNNLIILRGYVPNATSLNVIQELTKSFFPRANIVNEVIHGGVQQIQLEVVVAIVNRSELRQMTFNWIRNRSNFFAASLLTSPLDFTNSITTAITAATANGSTVGGNLIFGVSNSTTSFTAFLEALNTEKLANIMAIPTVVTQSGKPARFQSGGETPVLTSSGLGSPTVTYKSFGTVVEFLPVILDKGKISLEVTAEISAVDAAAGITLAGGSTVVPGFTVRRTQSTVTLEDGQTLAIGGLIQTFRNATNKKVPVLGDVPFLGALFSSKSDDFREEEMLILVTPRLVDPLACTQIPGYLPGRETRRPDDFELFLEGLLEAPRGQREICGDGRCYQAAHKAGPSADVFPCNDNTQPIDWQKLNVFNRVGGRSVLNQGGSCGPDGCTTAPPMGTYPNQGTPVHAAPVQAPSNGAVPTPSSPLPETAPAPTNVTPLPGLSNSPRTPGRTVSSNPGGYGGSGPADTPPLRVPGPGN